MVEINIKIPLKITQWDIWDSLTSEHLNIGIFHSQTHEGLRCKPHGTIGCLNKQKPYKNPAYGRQKISLPMRIEAPIPIKYICGVTKQKNN